VTRPGRGAQAQGEEEGRAAARRRSARACRSARLKVELVRSVESGARACRAGRRRKGRRSRLRSLWASSHLSRAAAAVELSPRARPSLDSHGDSHTARPSCGSARAPLVVGEDPGAFRDPHSSRRPSSALPSGTSPSAAVRYAVSEQKIGPARRARGGVSLCPRRRSGRSAAQGGGLSLAVARDGRTFEEMEQSVMQDGRLTRWVRRRRVVALERPPRLLTFPLFARFARPRRSRRRTSLPLCATRTSRCASAKRDRVARPSSPTHRPSPVTAYPPRARPSSSRLPSSLHLEALSPAHRRHLVLMPTHTSSPRPSARSSSRARAAQPPRARPRPPKPSLLPSRAQLLRAPAPCGEARTAAPCTGPRRARARPRDAPPAVAAVPQLEPAHGRAPPLFPLCARRRGSLLVRGSSGSREGRPLRPRGALRRSLGTGSREPRCARAMRSRVSSPLRRAGSRTHSAGAQGSSSAATGVRGALCGSSSARDAGRRACGGARSRRRRPCARARWARRALALGLACAVRGARVEVGRRGGEDGPRGGGVGAAVEGAAAGRAPLSLARERRREEEGEGVSAAAVVGVGALAGEGSEVGGGP